METKLTDKQETSATFEVTVPAARVEKAFEEVLSGLARQVRVPGFRPGKAPRGVLIKRIGEDALAQEVRDALVEEHYPAALRELKLSPVHAHFHAGEPQSGSDFTFEVHVDLYPEFELPALSEIVIDTAAPALSEEMVDSAVAELQNEHATLVPVERAAAAGDYVLVETLSGGEPSGNTLPIDLERVSPELAEQLVGKATGDEVELRLSGGEESEGEEAEETGEGEAAPQQAAPTLTVVVREVKEKEKPEPDDEFAKTLGFERWDEVLEQVRSSLTAQLEADAFEAQREEFIEKLMAETEVPLPQSLLNRRKATLLGNLAEDLKGKGLTLERYLASLDEEGKREGFEEELESAAQNALKRDLVLERLLELRGAELSDQEFADAVRYMAARQGKDAAKFRREMGEEWLENYRFLLRRDKAVREAVRELLGGDEATDDDSSAQEAQDEAPAEAQAEPPEEA